MSNAGRAVFEAVGQFSGLRREAKATEDALRRTRDAGKSIGDGIDAGSQRATSGLDKFIDKTGQIADKLNSTGKSLSLKLTTPLVGVGTLGVRSFANFEKSIVSAGAKSDATAKQFKQMKDLALDMGAKTMFSAGEAANSLDNLAALGMNAADSMKALPGVMKAAQATGEDLGLTTEVVAKAMNAWNVKAKDSGKVADLFAQAANTTALGMEDLAYGIANAGEVGPRFGQDMTGVIATLGRLVDLGVPAASAGVAIRSSLTNLAAPSTKASTLLEGLGIKTRDANGQMLQLPDLIANVSDGLDKTNPLLKKYNGVLGKSGDSLKEWAKQNGMTTGQAVDLQTAMEKGGSAFKDYATKTIFGVEGAKAFSLAMSKGKPVILDTQKDVEKLKDLQDGLAETMGKKQAKAWIKARTEQGKFTATGKDTVKALDAMNREADGTADKFVDVFGETTAAKLDAFFGSLETIGITLVQTVAPALKDATDKATKWINKIKEFSDKHDWFGPLIVGVGLFLAALGPVLIVLAQILKMTRGVAKVGRGVGRAIRKVGGRSPASTPAVVSDGDTSHGPQSVYWSKPMPVYLTKPMPGSPNGGKPRPGGSSTRPAVNPYSQNGRTFAQWKAANKQMAKEQRRQRVRTTVRKAVPVVGGAAAAGAGAAAITLATGGSVADAAKTGGLFAGIELAVVGVTKAAGKVGPALGKGLSAFGRFVGRVLAGFATMTARAVTWSLQMAARTAWWVAKSLASVAMWAAKMVGQIAWVAAKFIAKYALMAVQAAIQAAKIAASWLIAMGPIGWIIGIVAALVAAFVWAYKNVKWFRDGVNAACRAIGDAWRWLWNNVLQPVFSSLVKGIAWIMDKFGDMLDVMSHVPGFGWAKTAANLMHSAADKARDLADGIKKIPPRKDVVISVATIYTTKGQGGKAALQNILDKQAGDPRLNIPGQRTGGLVSGHGRGDKQLRLLEAGEFVMRRSVVAQPGMLQRLLAWNRSGAGRATDVLPTAGRLAGDAMARGATAVGSAVSDAVTTDARPVDGRNGRRGGDLTVVVNNPIPETAGRSLGSSLRSRTHEMGWAV